VAIVADGSRILDRNRALISGIGVDQNYLMPDVDRAIVYCGGILLSGSNALALGSNQTALWRRLGGTFAPLSHLPDELYSHPTSALTNNNIVDNVEKVTNQSGVSVASLNESESATNGVTTIDAALVAGNSSECQISVGFSYAVPGM
jgi:hypothetical protein